MKSALKTRGTLNAEFYLHIYLLDTPSIQSTLTFINRNGRLDRKFQPVLRKRRILSREICFCPLKEKRVILPDVYYGRKHKIQIDLCDRLCAFDLNRATRDSATASVHSVTRPKIC